MSESTESAEHQKSEDKPKGIFFLLLARFWGILLQLISVPFCIKIIGTENYGIAIVVLTIRSVCQLIDFDATQGLMQILSKTFRVDLERGWKIFRTGFGLHLVIGLTGLALLTLIPYFLPLSPEVATHPLLHGMFLTAGLIFLVDNCGAALNAPFMAQERFKELARLTYFIPTLVVLLTMLMVWILKSPLAMLLSGLIDSSLNMIIRFKYIRKFSDKHHLGIELDKGIAKEILLTGFKSYVPGLCTRLAQTMDKLIIERVLGATTLTIYNLACRVPQLLLEILNKTSEAIMPEMAHVANNEPEKFAKVFRRNYTLVGGLSVCGILIISSFGQPFMQAWQGTKFPDIGLVMLLMGVYYSFELHHSTLVRAFFSVGKAHLILPFAAWNALVTIFATGPIASRFGLVGVGWMNVFIDVVQIIPLHYYFVHHVEKSVSPWVFIGITAKLFGIASLVAGGTYLLTRNIPLGRPSFLVLPLAPLLACTISVVLVRLGVVMIPDSVKRILNRKFPILVKVYGI